MKDLSDLTARQKVVLATILAYAGKHHSWPTIRALKQLLASHSTNGVSRYLDVLIKKGYIRRLRYGQAQNYEVRGCELRLCFESSRRGGFLADLARSVDLAALEVSR